METTQGLDDTFERIAPEDRGAVRAEPIRAVRERDTYATEYRIVRPDGSIRWLRGRGRAFYSDTGEPRNVTGTTIDVTERREAEAALRVSEEKFARAFQASPDCITISEIGSGRMILEVNDRFEEMTGYARTEALGRTIVDLGLVDGALRDRWLASCKGAARFATSSTDRPQGRQARDDADVGREDGIRRRTALSHRAPRHHRTQAFTGGTLPQ